MKRKMTFSLTLTVSLLLSLIGFAESVQGQQRLKPVDDTGVITLGTNEMLRLTVAAGDVNGDGSEVQFRQVGYGPVGCNGAVCEHTVVSQSTSSPLMLMPGEAASIDIVKNGNSAVRAMVLSDNPNVKVNAMIVNMTTGNIICVLVGG
jgi:hypothetical protein